ncbi:MAG: DUF2330 domain-containing protein [Candidatus Edwardsbacteria bacterium]
MRILTFFIILFLLFISPSFADRGMIPISKPNVSVYEPGQKAIIAWNGHKEILILSTDASASDTCKVLGILPLPSKPKIEKGDFKSFEEIQRIIEKHAPRVVVRGLKGEGEMGAPGVEILFHQKIGAHDLTCVKANDYQEFIHWTKNFLIQSKVEWTQFPHSLETIVKDYLLEKIKYFVFDIIEVTPETKSIDPLIYSFKSKYLWYPLKISTLVSGETRIQLFLLTKEMPDTLSEEIFPFKFGSYLSRRKEATPIIFQTNGEELEKISPEARKLFYQEKAYLSVIHYKGLASDFKKDLKLKKFFGSSP